MEENPIDELNSIELNLQKTDPVVKAVAVALFLIVSVFSFLCLNDLMRLIESYFYFRHKYVASFSINSVIAVMSFSSIPMFTYYHWRRKYQNRGFIPYLVLLFVTSVLYLFCYILGMELLFTLPKPVLIENPLLPDYIIYPPFPFYFDLLFILSAILPFIIFQLVIRKRKE